MLRFVWCPVVLIMCVLLMDCSGGGDVVARYCTAQCKKLGSCNTLGGVSESICITNCKDSSNQNIGPCSPPAAEMDKCIAAIENSGCPFTLPIECQNLCSGSKNDGVTGDSGNNTDSTSNPPPENAGRCSPVQGICVIKQDDRTQCQAYSNQLSVVLDGLRSKCQTTKNATWTDGAANCLTAVPDLNYGCEISSAAGCTTSYDKLDSQAKGSAEQGCTMGGGRVVSP